MIPALDEAEALPALLGDLAGLGDAAEVVVVDGGSSDGTVRAARDGGAVVMRGRTGRARQLNAGAALLSTPWLLMLHADSRLDGAALAAIAGHAAAGNGDAAHLDLAIDHPDFYYRLIEGGQRARRRRMGLVYGDQGLLIPRGLFYRVGPYPDEPIMEDVILNRRLIEAGRLRMLDAAVVTSARRYEEEGRIRAWLRNAGMIYRFLTGTPASELAASYPPRRAGPEAGPAARADPAAGRARAASARPRAQVLVFAKAPRPGSVKTRLARALGDEGAAALYRRMGRLVMDQLAGTPARVTVCHDPPGAEAEMRAWLGPVPERYRPQGDGDLGRRMARMFESALRETGRAVAIGMDAPAVNAGTVDRAAAALESADVVLGPAADGGYYLLGLRAMQPELFRDMPWSTGAVLAETAARARKLGLEVTYLEVESDIDRPSDLAALTPAAKRLLGLPRRSGPAA